MATEGRLGEPLPLEQFQVKTRGHALGKPAFMPKTRIRISCPPPATGVT